MKIKEGDAVYLVSNGDTGVVKSVWKDQRTGQVKVWVSFQRGSSILTTSYSKENLRLVADQTLLEWMDSLPFVR